MYGAVCMNRLYFCTVFRVMQELNAVCLNYLQIRLSHTTNREETMTQAALSCPDIDDDYVLWMERQIDLIRERQFVQLDIDNLLGELAYFVAKQKRGLRSRLRVLMLHLLKCEYQPALRSNSWISTICTQRRKVEDLLEDSPSLKSLVEPDSQAEYKRAVRQAVIETGLARTVFPDALPYTEQQLFDFDFIP